MSCPVCLAKSPKVFLSHLGVPVHQNLLMNTQESALNILRGDLRLAVCQECGFIFNQAFDVSKLDYGKTMKILKPILHTLMPMLIL